MSKSETFIEKNTAGRSVTSENSFDFPVSVSFVNLSKLPMRMIQWEWHEEIEFLIFTNGNALVNLPDRVLNLSEGQGLFLNHNLMHSVSAADDSACALYILKFHPSFLFGYGQTYIASKYLTPILTSSQLRYLILDDEKPETAELFRQVSDVITCCSLKQYAYELKAKSGLCSLWTTLLSFARSMQRQEALFSRQTYVDSTRVKGALEYITENYAEPLTLEDIASSIHVSKSECCRCFQRALGITPFEFLTKFRIFESTRKMLSDSPDYASVSALAQSVGFNNISYYNKLFKKYLGCTPTQYKNAMRGGLMQDPETP